MLEPLPVSRALDLPRDIMAPPIATEEETRSRTGPLIVMARALTTGPEAVDLLTSKRGALLPGGGYHWH
jgi:hypothetical protein